MADVRTTALVIVAVGALVLPLAFVGAVVIAAIGRRQGAVLGPNGVRAIAGMGGLALGSMLLVTGGDLTVGLPFIVVAAALAANEWRVGRRGSAGWLVAGTALPWTLLWGAYLVLMARGEDLDARQVVASFAAGALPLAVGLVLAGRYDADAAEETAPRRTFGVIARAIREPSQVGPFRLPELAAVIAWVVVGLALAFIPTGSAEVRLVIAAVIGSALASEAYVRAMAPASRQAFEAFSWLGEQDLAALRRLTSDPVPLNRRAAEAWLARHPMTTDEPPSIRSLRVQALLMAGRANEARAAATERQAARNPEDRFEQAADRQLVAWWTADPGARAGLAALDEDARAILPHDSDPHLRAAVTLAVAQVRQRAVEGGGAANPLDVIAPLLAMRPRLGARADGLVRRVLWRRLFGVFLTASVAIGLVSAVTGLFGGP